MAAFIDVQETISTARRGMVADNSGDFETKIATAAVQAGLVLTYGATEDKCKVPTSAAEVAKSIGASAYVALREPTGDGVNEYAAGDFVNLLRQGEIWVTTEDSPSPGQQVFVRYSANGGNTTLGACRTDGDTSHAASISASFLTAASGGLARIRLNLP